MDECQALNVVVLGFGKGAVEDWNFKPAGGFRELEPDIAHNPPAPFHAIGFVMSDRTAHPSVETAHR